MGSSTSITIVPESAGLAAHETCGESSGLSILPREHWHGLRLKTALVRFVRNLRGAVAANPELFLPVTCLFVWQVTTIAAKPTAFGFALLLTAVLFIYGYRVLGRTEWLCRVAWVCRVKDSGFTASSPALPLPSAYGGLPGPSMNPWEVPLPVSGFSGQFIGTNDRGDPFPRSPLLGDL